MWHIYVCGRVLVHACACGSQRQTSDLFAGSLLHFIFGTVFHTEPEAHVQMD